MPALITHMLCGDKSITISGCEQLRKIIQRNSNAFHIGCEGPDPYMYYSVLPWEKYDNIEKVRDCADIIHFGVPTEFFKVLIERVKETMDEVQIAYLAGFICHHALDSTAHPYVYYETGSKKERAGKLHRLFEKQLDYAVLNEFGLKLTDYKAHKKTKLSKEHLERIAQIVVEGLDKALDTKMDVQSTVLSYQSMEKAENFLYDPIGLKRPVISLAGSLVGDRDLALSMMVPTFYDEEMDVLNKRGEIWYEPTDETISHTENFMQLFNMAAQKTANRLLAIEDYLYRNEKIENVLDVIGNASYENGRVGYKMYYYKLDQKNDN